MLKALRLCLLMLIMLSVALAGPVQANCNPQPDAATIPCGDMAMADAAPEQPQPDAPQQPCSIIQCPPALPGFTGGSSELQLPVARPLSRMAILSPAPPGADTAPEQRPPIS